MKPYTPWTRAEDDILFAHYESHGAGVVSRKTGRSVNAVRMRAQYFGLMANRSTIENAGRFVRLSASSG